MRILSLDPGESTGVAYMDGPRLLWSKTVTNAVDGFVKEFRAGLPWCNALVIESFIVDPTFVGRAFASEVIGAAVALRAGEMYTFQSRADKATLMRGTEAQRFAWLREQGFTGTSHELDAITHNLLFSRKSGDAEVVKAFWS